jgi:hypothetical protein
MPSGNEVFTPYVKDTSSTKKAANPFRLAAFLVGA